MGHDVMNELAKRGYEGVGSDIKETYSGIQDGTAVVSMPYVQMDITDEDSVRKVLTDAAPDVVVHCAAWTAVDLAEDEDKKETVYAVNATGTKNIAEVCKELDCKMVYLSTDYVFDGQGTEAWQPDCKDYKPLNVYGETKLAGELAVSETLSKYFIVRIAWVFGKNGKNFIKTMASLADRGISLGHEEYSEDKVNVIPVTTQEYGASKAARPFNSRLDKSKLPENGFTPLPTWQDALNRYLKEIEF